MTITKLFLISLTLLFSMSCSHNNKVNDIKKSPLQNNSVKISNAVNPKKPLNVLEKISIYNTEILNIDQRITAIRNRMKTNYTALNSSDREKFIILEETEVSGLEAQKLSLQIEKEFLEDELKKVQ